MSYCAVATCRNYRRRGKSYEISFFRFPKDPTTCATWMRRCSRQDTVNVSQARICSDHFLESDYDTAFQVKASVMPGVKPKLKTDAVPTQKLKLNIAGPSEQAGPSSRFLRSDRRKMKFLAQDIINTKRDSSSLDDRSSRDECAKLRKERNDKRERKQLVERLLAGLPDPSEEALQRVPKPGTVHRRSAPVLTGVLAQQKKAQRRLKKPCSRPAVVVGNDGSDHDYQDDGPPSDDDDTPAAGTAPAPFQAGTDALSQCKGKRSDPLVSRAMDLLRMKSRVRRLEDKCRLLLGLPGFARPRDELEIVLGKKIETGEKPATAEAGGSASGADPAEKKTGEEASTEKSAAEKGDVAASGETPLMVLREEKSQQEVSFPHPPAVVSMLRQCQPSDELMSTTPSDLQQALDQNHSLKMQSLAMQEAVLRWALKDKRSRDARNEELRKKQAGKMVRGSRLKELLRLETAIKAIFTESQIKALTRRLQRQEGKKLLVVWSDEDIRRVLDLRALSSDKVVEHVRLQMKIPLPGMQVVKRRCRKNAELQEHYRSAMERAAASEKLCSMCQRGVDTIDEVAVAVASLPAPERDFSWQPSLAAPPARRSRGGKTPKPSQRPTMGGKRPPTTGGKRPPPSHDQSSDSSDSDSEYDYSTAMGAWPPKAVGRARGGIAGRARKRGGKTGPPAGYSPRKKARGAAAPESRWSDKSDSGSDGIDEGIWGHVPEFSHWRGSSQSVASPGTSQYKHLKRAWEL